MYLKSSVLVRQVRIRVLRGLVVFLHNMSEVDEI